MRLYGKQPWHYGSRWQLFNCENNGKTLEILVSNIAFWLSIETVKSSKLQRRTSRERFAERISLTQRKGFQVKCEADSAAFFECEAWNGRCGNDAAASSTAGVCPRQAASSETCGSTAVDSGALRRLPLPMFVRF
ncbi:hypothetical protein Nepgr_029051 [Nepenthes gracilis]|uniref:Uncharacterized protein n=1 Tax=Nepenthes gracilis TaxID=150966 RepID=A0AAD3Y2Y3_NEPGR|nr:hypothetical protein Nepgr_029051 [Nepenthes gracilis]